MSRTIRYIKNKTIRTVEFEEELKKAKKNKKFDYEYVKALYVDFMSNPMNQIDRKKSKIIFCRAYNVPPGLISVWEVNKDLQKEIRANVRELFGGGERIKELYDLLWEQCRAGRVSAIKLAMEVVGEYTPKLQHLDKPKNLEDYLDRMDKREEKEEADGSAVTRH